jgi:sarcosine oxidase subunit alpha
MHGIIRQQAFRRPQGGLVDRSRPISFSFDGRTLYGVEGDTLASALLANGVRLVGRGFKYHRPRGILSAGPEEPNALVEVRTGARREPNTRATVAEIFEGLEASSQNRFPSLKFDLMAVNSLAAPVFAAGFYYKTFMWPAAFWERLYEPMIRRAAGLGRASGVADPDSYEKQSVFADLLVVGAGPAGLAAALAAGRAGARVVLAEQDFALGGRLLADRYSIGGRDASAWLQQVVDDLASLPNVRVLRRTTVMGVFDGGTYAAVERVSDHVAAPAPGCPRQVLWRIVAPRAVLATGAIERPLVFGGNDTPGVMLAGAVRAYVNRFAVLPGSKAVVFANNDDGASTVADLVEAGVAVAAYVDSRARVPDAVRTRVEAAGVKLLAGSWVKQAKGGQALSKVVLGGQAQRTVLECDLLAVSGGWSPVVHLASHHGGKPVWREDIAAFVPGPMPPGMVAAGSAAGHLLLSQALAGGAEAGAGAAREAGLEAAAVDVPASGAESAGIEALWQVPDSQGKAFVDFQNDVTAPDVALAAREGFTAVEHLKRYTTLGMATDQGKTSNVVGLALMAAQTGRSIAQTGTTVFRPPYTPVAVGVFAGHHRGRDFKPTRLTPAHAWAKAQGAVFVEAGEWMRAAYFPQSGEADWQTSTNREVLTVRSACGFCDVTTLGKIDVQGPDAGKFLDFVYANAMAGLAVGRARYGLMLREDGLVFDDGTVARLSPTHFVITTTTANAGRVLRHMEFCRQVLRPDLCVCIEPVTDQWAQFAVAGPHARRVVASVVDPGTDIGNAAFPFMAAAEMPMLGGVAGRLFRISFSGEMAYEVAVPARHGEALAQALHAAGAVPYGLEALNVMRIEKGHPTGAELDGRTSAADLGMGKMLSTKKEFIGRAMAQRPALLDPQRPQLVGIKPVAGGVALQAGAHMVPLDGPADAAHDQGHVSSVAYSATLGHWIGLAFVAGGSRRIGERMRAVNPLQGREAEVEIVSKVFVDPEGSRLHG